MWNLEEKTNKKQTVNSKINIVEGMVIHFQRVLLQNKQLTQLYLPSLLLGASNFQT